MSDKQQNLEEVATDGRWPGESDEAHPEVFNTVPPAPKERKSGMLTEEQTKQLFQDGFVVIDNFFSTDELQPVRDATSDLVENLAQKLYNAGKIKKLYREHGLFQRLTKIEQEFPGANIILHKLGALPKAYGDLWSNERLLNMMEHLLQSKDIIGHPVWNLRTKTPKNQATTVPWHQDSAYLDNDSYKVLTIGAWIPLLDANETNGCMQFVKGGHKTGKIAKHTCCHAGTWYVMLEEDEMEKTLEVNMKEDGVTLPVPYGGMIIFNNLVPHRSLNNFSKDIRWSLDLRWQRADQPTGFFGAKDGVRMRSSDPNHKIDWESFNSVNRHETVHQEMQNEVMDEFDTTIIGQWMRKWEVVNENSHTKALEEQERSGGMNFTPVITG